MIAETIQTSSDPKPIKEKRVKKKDPDTALVARFKSGDESAFTEIANKHRDFVIRAAFSVLRNHSDAEDVAQGTFVAAYRSMHEFREESSLASWLYLIARNLAKNRYWYFFRRKRQCSSSIDGAIAGNESITYADIIPSNDVGLLRSFAAKERLEIVRRCMCLLGHKHAEILRMRVQLDMSYGQMAKALGINEGTVKSRLGRARKELLWIIENRYPDFT